MTPLTLLIMDVPVFTLRVQMPSLQQGLHIATSIGDQEDVYDVARTW